jgi:hypothetical protein
MKHTHVAILTVIFIAIIVGISCKKNGNYNNTGTSVPLNQLFSDLKTSPQNFSVIAGKSQTIIGSDSTAINFYPNSFKDKNGNIITSGTVDIQLIEMYGPGSMIANHTSATAVGSLIQSAGQINIVASMNGQEVYANKYGIALKQKSYSSKQMELYYGANSGPDSMTTWSVAYTTKNGTKAYITRRDSVQTKDTTIHYNLWANTYYLFDSCTTFKWVNGDHFYGDSAIIATVIINLSDNTFTDANTEVFIVYPAINSTQTFHGTYNSANKTFINTHQNLPKGQNMDIVVIANKAGSYYYYQQTGIPVSANITVNAAMVNDTRGDVVARLHGL